MIGSRKEVSSRPASSPRRYVKEVGMVVLSLYSAGTDCLIFPGPVLSAAEFVPAPFQLRTQTTRSLPLYATQCQSAHLF